MLNAFLSPTQCSQLYTICYLHKVCLCAICVNFLRASTIFYKMFSGTYIFVMGCHSPPPCIYKRTQYSVFYILNVWSAYDESHVRHDACGGIVVALSAVISRKCVVAFIVQSIETALLIMSMCAHTHSVLHEHRVE